MGTVAKSVPPAPRAHDLRHCRDFKLYAVENMLRDKIRNVTAEDWKNNIRHVMDLEAKFRLDTSESDYIHPIVVQLGEG